MPFFDASSLSPIQRASQRARNVPAARPAAAGALDPGEFQIKILLPNDQAAQALATGIFRAIIQAHRTWQSTATLIGVTVNSVTATGGILVGPPLTPLIAANLVGTNAFERKVVQAVALVVGNSWISFSGSVKVPGLPWYPAFAAFPSPMAPPTPNVPTPFAALTQSPALISKGFMKPQIMAQLLPDKSANGIVDAVLSAFEQFILLWVVRTLVTNVLGSGPVPTFAPPFVPVGPVVGGIAVMVPGGLI